MALPAQAIPNPNIANYQLLEKIAAGGMGVVYKAFDLSLQRTVALKFVSLDHASHRSEREILLREARAASALDHENIAAIHHIGETGDGQLFIDMGYYEGEDLATRMRRAPLTIADSVDVVSQVARGLAHAHAHNVIHRDIKPSNIVLTKDGTAKIVDFGLARVLSPEASTVSLDVAGTLAYMSPEQLTGKSIDARTDIWSLGAVFYELLTQSQPFPHKSAATILNAILNSEPDRLCDVPTRFRCIVEKAMQKDPQNRYQNCSEFLRDLDAARLDRGTSPNNKKRARWLPGTHLLRWGVTLAVVLAALMVFPPRVNHSVKAPSPAPDELYKQGLVLLDRFDKPGNLKSAIQKFDETTKVDPRFALAYAALAEAYVDKFRLEQNPDWLERARENCNKATQINSRLATVHVTMARINIFSKQYDLAQQDIQHALEIDPKNVKALVALADVLSEMSHYSAAEANYKKAVTLRPDDWEAHFRLGGFYVERKRYDSAIEQYRKVLSITPDNAIAHSNLAAVLSLQNKNREAEQEMLESLRIAPSYAGYYNLALDYYRQKRYGEALAVAELAKGQSEADYKVWQLLGLCHEWMNHPAEAVLAYQQELRALEKSAALKTDDAVAQAELALLYSKLQQKDDAVKHMQTALTLKPEDPEVLALAGEVYENLADRSQALWYFESALQKGWDVARLYGNPDLRGFLKDAEVQKRIANIKPNPSNQRI